MLPTLKESQDFKRNNYVVGDEMNVKLRTIYFAEFCFRILPEVVKLKVQSTELKKKNSHYRVSFSSLLFTHNDGVFRHKKILKFSFNLLKYGVSFYRHQFLSISLFISLWFFYIHHPVIHTRLYSFDTSQLTHF